MLDHKGRKRARQIGALGLFTVVNPFVMVLTDPLTPAVQREVPVNPMLFARKVGITDEEEVSRVSGLGQLPYEPRDPDSETTSLGIRIRSLERDNDERRVFRLEHSDRRL